MEFILAVDHGTSGVKAALVSVYGEVHGFEFEKTPLYLLPEGGAEQNANEWWQAFKTAVIRLLKNQKISKDDIKAICISGQWGCTVAVDQSGEPLMNAISWMDSRGEPYIKKLMGGLIKISGYGISNIYPWVIKTAGAPALAGKDPIAHIIYLKNEHPEIYNAAYKFLDSKDFMNMKLTGKFTATFDSIAMHWICDIRDLNNIHYDPSLMKKLGVEPNKFPDLLRSIDCIGNIKAELADELGLNHDVKVFGGSGDLQACAIGSGAIREFEPHIYIGTSSFLISHVPFKKTDIFHNIATFPSPNPKLYFMATEQESAGACLTFLRDKLLIKMNVSEKNGNNTIVYEPSWASYSEIDKFVELTKPGCDNLIFTPWLYGERTPVEDAHLRGGFHNISLEHSLNHFIRAVFEGVAFNTRWVMKYAEKFNEHRLDPINIIGGGATSNVWCQIFADVLGRTIRKLKNPIQSNVRGAAFIGSVGLGKIQFEDIPKYIEFDGIFTPNSENHAIYSKLFTQFVKIYERNRAIYHKLNERVKK
jgi:xylulokinase